MENVLWRNLSNIIFFPACKLSMYQTLCLNQMAYIKNKIEIKYCTAFVTSCIDKIQAYNNDICQLHLTPLYSDLFAKGLINLIGPEIDSLL